MKASTISHQATQSFSKLVTGYLSDVKDLAPFYRFRPDPEGLDQAIEERKRIPVNRPVLVEVLKEQYRDYELSPAFQRQIESLLSESTFTVCTAHQPDLMTGYLYFFYKIIHAAKLADYLKERHPENNFVPVFYIGSEDNDFDELSVFHYEGKAWRWQTGQTGAVGRMNTDDLKPLVKTLTASLIPPGENRDHLIKIISEAYDGRKTIAQAIRHIVHAFLGKFGVVVLDADDERLKRCYLPVMADEIRHSKAETLVKATSAQLNEHYPTQAFARPVNLFYLKDNIRERIEREDNGWKVLRTDISWPDSQAILAELEAHPERFSPNVILRGPYQESILPDVAFIGGGSEVAYWLQLKEVYDHYGIFFPAVILRQSALWMSKNAVDLQHKLKLSDEELFLPLNQLEKNQVLSVSEKELDLYQESGQLAEILERIKCKAGNIDPTLISAAEAVKAKINHLTGRLEKKMLRAEKRHYDDRMRQISRLKSLLFPNNHLQERHDCFLELYLQYGEQFTQIQYEYTLPFGNCFLLVKES
ncbi:MAG TPA: bacillithiol biosynthesis cysteine-adding enzyme BshC [Edaphocola sp.]|nr:bacillithiol biosynthesis cysteine-adding enzyme BshC [Edaphocola sp.]